MLARLLTVASALILLIGAGCTNGNTPNFDDPGLTSVTLTCTPATPVTGSPANINVTAHNGLTTIDTISVDFENDGTWDAQQTYDAMSVSASFVHTYDAAGSVIARADVKDANGGVVSKTLLMIVETPPPVSNSAR